MIDASDSAERWRELLETIEELAARGEAIDCSQPPMDVQHASTPLRATPPGAGGKRAGDEEAAKDAQ